MAGTRDYDDEVETRVAPGRGDSADDVPTAQHADVGVVAELHAVLAQGDARMLALYQLADEIVVGRGSKCDWQLEDNSLSRRHATFHWSGAALEVEDMGSANGTRVDGVLVSGRAPVPLHSTVQLGTVTISLLPPEGAEDDAPPPAPPPPSAAPRAPTSSPPSPAPASGGQQVTLGEMRAMLKGEAPQPAAPFSGPVPPSAMAQQPLAPVQPSAPPAPPQVSQLPTQLQSKRSFAPVPSHQLETRLSPGSRPKTSPTEATRVSRDPRIAALQHNAAQDPIQTPIAVTAVTPLPRGSAGQAVFRPAHNAAGADEPTAQWDPAMVLVKREEKVLDVGGLWQRVVERWRTNRRPFVLAGAALWVGVLLLALTLHERRQEAAAEDDEPPRALVVDEDTPAKPPAGDEPATTRAAPSAPPTSPEPSEPKVTALDPTGAPKPTAADESVTADPEQLLAEAIAAYDQGKTDEALAAFRKLAAASPDDTAPKYMIDLLTQGSGK